MANDDRTGHILYVVFMIGVVFLFFAPAAHDALLNPNNTLVDLMLATGLSAIVAAVAYAAAFFSK